MCDAVLVVPKNVPLPTLRGKVRRYFEERYDKHHLVFVFIPSRTRCYARVQKVLPRARGESEIRLIERTLEYDLFRGEGAEIMEVPA